MAQSRSWKMERASVHRGGGTRPRSNKYSASDKHDPPPPGSRQRVWVGGYKKSDGTAVTGHYRGISATKAGA
jgi:hypothetical protein